MAKQIVTGENSRQAILRGVNILADAVKITLISGICTSCRPEPGQRHAYNDCWTIIVLFSGLFCQPADCFQESGQNARGRVLSVMAIYQ